MNIVEINNLSKSYGGAKALDNLSLEIPPGKIIGLLGPNGSGKTTLIKVLMGLIKDYTGSVSVFGQKPGEETCAGISYLPDRAALPAWLTVNEAINFYNDFFADFDMPRAAAMTERMGINKKQRLKTLSKGTGEKLQLALVMSRRAKLYILDEPIAAVDPAAREYIIDTIIQNFDKEGSMLLSTHLIADIEPVLDTAVFIKDGGVIRNEDVEILRQTAGESVDAVFRRDFKCL